MTRSLWFAIVAVGVVSLGVDWALSPSQRAGAPEASRPAPPRLTDSAIRALPDDSLMQLGELHPMTSAETTSSVVTLTLLIGLAVFAARQGLGWRAALVPCLSAAIIVIPAFVVSASRTPSGWPLMVTGYAMLAVAAVIPGIAGVTIHRIARRFS